MISLNTASRRAILTGGGALGLGLIAPKLAFAQGADVIGETTYGQIKGIDVSGTKAFKGVPYGADTGGKNRFLPPQKPAPWTSVRDALAFGPTAPQPAATAGEYEKLIGRDAPLPAMSEDCLTLNVWTRGLKDGAKRPVLVSFHGGDFTTGSSSVGYDGQSLVQFADVVCVTVNHRLGALGFLDISSVGAPNEYARSGNAGMLDLVASLEWVRDNIANFGGDPGCVMIFGHASGGSKVAALCAMPAAKGLFHRAAIQSSPNPIHALDRDEASDAAGNVFRNMGIRAATDVPKLMSATWQEIIAAHQASARATNNRPPPPLGPVLDPVVLPKHPFDPAAPAFSADVPLIVSNCLEDAAMNYTNFGLDEDGFNGFADVVAGEGISSRAVPLYQKDGAKTPFLEQARMETDRVYSHQAIIVAERKAALGPAPVYRYVWAKSSAGAGGKFGAVLGSDVGPTFHAPGGVINGDSAEANALKDKMAATWVAFAKTGNPNNPAIPNWPAYDAKTRATLIFDDNTRVENDPRPDLRQLWDELQD